MELEELIVEIVIGLFLLFTSYQIGIKENITLLHGYHYTQLDPKDKKVFTKKIGIGTLLVSIGILVMPIINLISHSELGYYIGLILIVVGVFYIIFIIVKYNGNILLVVEDNGCGIKASDLSRVFEKGFTGSNRNKANATGMGLYLSKKLCDRLGLKLDIASTEKEYTRLTITFPKGTVHNFSE